MSYSWNQVKAGREAGYFNLFGMGVLATQLKQTLHPRPSDSGVGAKSLAQGTRHQAGPIQLSVV